MTVSYILSDENRPNLPMSRDKPSPLKRAIRRAQRFLRKRDPWIVKNPNIHPYASIALLVAYDENMKVRLAGTAFLYKPNIVITAAHCLSDEQLFKDKTDRKAKLIKLYFGLQKTPSGDFKVTGEATSKRLFLHPSYNVKFESGTDIGFAILNNASTLNSIAVQGHVEDTDQVTLDVIGYPSQENPNFNGYQMAASSASGGYFHDTLFGYLANSLEGMSGGPVHATNSVPQSTCAVHANNKEQWGGPRPKRSSGFNLDANILKWINTKSAEILNHANFSD